jgi:hypothetical protein
MPFDTQAYLKEAKADNQLNQAGSVMGSAKAGERETLNNQGPLIYTLLQLLKGGGMDPTTAGGPGQQAGVFRELGLLRKGGDLNPAQYLMQAQAQPGYQRFQQLVQNMIRRSLGESIPVARGAAQTDPLIQALQAGRQAPVTAVTTQAEGMFPTAERFAQTYAETSRKPSYVMQGTAAPEDVAGLLPRRGTPHAHESELILNPTPGFQGNLVARYSPPSGSFPVQRNALPQPPASTDPAVQELMKALQEAAQPPR